MDKKYSIFISSTYEDLQEYRKSINDAIIKDGHFPIGMEQFLASSKSQWDIIKNLIDECDYYILILGFRYGSIDSESGISFTEKEYDYAYRTRKTILSFHLDDKEFNLSSKDDDLRNIKKFRKKVLDNGQNAQVCRNKHNLSSDIITALNNEYKTNPQTGWIRDNSSNIKQKNITKINDIENSIMNLFKENKTINLSDIEKKLKKYEKQKIKYHLDNLEELEYLIFHQSNTYYMDSRPCYELLESGRKYLFRKN
jgi:integrase